MIQGQLNLFDREKYKIKNKIRLIELFAGIGSQAKALTNLEANFEHWKICEFDKYAVTSYNAVHNTNFQTSDITKLKGEDLQIEETDKYTYIMTYSFPCQDLSLAGKQQGMGVGTRSGLLWEVERLLKETKHLPQVLLMENVPQVKGTKNIEHFRKWLDFLSSLGYSNKYECLNAKNYGIPQNRDRCFMVSILGDYSYEFPQGKPLKLRLKDMLESEVDEKYFLSDKAIAYITSEKRLNSWCKIDSDITMTVTSVGQQNWTGDFVTEPQIKVVANLNIPGRHESACRVYSTDGIAPACKTNCGGGHETKIIKPLAYDEQNNYIRLDGTVGTLTADGSSPKHNNRVVEPLLKTSQEKTAELIQSVQDGYYEEESCYGKYLFQSSRFTDKPIKECSQAIKAGKVDCGVIYNHRIRKLTPREVWRLMGFTDEDFDKAKATGMSNSQLYKQAGNSIVVNVLEEIFKEML